MLEKLLKIVLLVNCVLAAALAQDTIFYNDENDVRFTAVQPEIVKIFKNCHRNSTTFDLCMRTAFNDLRVYFKSGMVPRLHRKNIQFHSRISFIQGKISTDWDKVE